jgi:CRISPR-associated endonuclease/helicase Cas3
MYFNKDRYIEYSRIIDEKALLYAHKNGSELELLKDHTKHSQDYFLKLVIQKRLDSFFTKIEEKFWGGASSEVKDIFRNMIQNTISFHDYGKSNPRFQTVKMGNKAMKGVKDFAGLGSSTHHSALSAALYLEYYSSYAKLVGKEYKKIYKLFLHVNGYIISRHHSNLCNFKNIFKEDNEVYNLRCELKNQELLGIYLNFTNGKNFIHKNAVIVDQCLKEFKDKDTKLDWELYLYTYTRIMYSLVVASDYYATTLFMKKIDMIDYGCLDNVIEYQKKFYKTERYQSIQQFKQNKRKKITKADNINHLRNEMFLESEKSLLKNLSKNIYFLEAPTGIGKSTVALNLSLKLIESLGNMDKIYYVYPFNTLVEQNEHSLYQIFGDDKNLYSQITIINSITPIKRGNYNKRKIEENESNEELYTKDLLNRQFLNYPFVLTTSVSLFNIMFGDEQSDTFAFHQLANSVIVLDEVQSYKPSIWAEIIRFLNTFATLLNIRVIIMSATLPQLDMFLYNNQQVANLIKNPLKYFQSPFFAKRSQISYELLDKKTTIEDLLNLLDKEVCNGKRIMIEFITKKHADRYYELLSERYSEDQTKLLFMSGDSNIIDRSEVLEQVNMAKKNRKGILLVATQVIEAGVDIDMEVGFKDISKIDSEEQFMGRINRSCEILASGKIFFFDLDSPSTIYKNDVRVSSILSLKNQEMRTVLEDKDFSTYYKRVIKEIQKNNKALTPANLELFMRETVGQLQFVDIAKRMKLIDEQDTNTYSVFLSRRLYIKKTDTYLDGEEIWNSYIELLQGKERDYAKKIILLSEIRSKMSYFIYDIKKFPISFYNKRIGELYYIENGDDFFTAGKIDMKKLETGNMIM